MRHTRTVVVVAALALAGCTANEARAGAELVIGARAAQEAASAMGSASRQLTLSADEVARVAADAGVTDAAVRDLAPTLEAQSTWQRSMQFATDLNSATDGDVRDVALGLACDGLKGEIGSEQELYDSLVDQLAGLATPEVESVYESTVNLWNDLYQASTTGTDEDKVAVEIACYSLEQFN